MKHEQAYYDEIKQKFADERDLRLKLRPEGTSQFTSDLSGDLGKYAEDPYVTKISERTPINDSVEVLFIGGGFSALLTSARLRERGIESVRIVERGSDVGGTWYWNRYPGVACDVVSYDYLPLLDELDYVPKHHYSRGDEILNHCKAIAKKYNLYDLAVFQTTVISTTWLEDEKTWCLKTDRGDTMKAKFVICANGTLSKPKLARIDGIESYQGHSFHTSRWDYDYTGQDLSNLNDKVVGIIGTGATAVQAVPALGQQSKELYIFQRTPSSIDIRDDWQTDQAWANSLLPGWQTERRNKAIRRSQPTEQQLHERRKYTQAEKIQHQENNNIDYMMRIHRRIDKEVDDPVVADALKPWYMFMCKRPCFHNEYLATYNRQNVHLVDTHGEGITQITAQGPVFKDQQFKLDLLIFATGFEVQKTGIYNKIMGKGGLDLEHKYSNGIRTLFGIHSVDYPNLFIMGGYQASFQFNLTYMLQTQGDHIADCIAHTRENGFDMIEPHEEAEQWWVQEVINHRGKTTRNEDCTPGYYNFEGESQRRQDGNYNGGITRYLDHMESSRADMTKHYRFS